MARLVLPATTLSRLCGPDWKGVLLLGPDEDGRRDLTRQALDAGCRLVAAYHSTLWSSGGYLYAAATDQAQAGRAMTRLHLAVLVQGSQALPPPDGTTSLLGHVVPTLYLDPRRASAVTRLITGLRQA